MKNEQYQPKRSPTPRRLGTQCDTSAAWAMWIPHVLLRLGAWAQNSVVFLKIHSECAPRQTRRPHLMQLSDCGCGLLMTRPESVQIPRKAAPFWGSGTKQGGAKSGPSAQTTCDKGHFYANRKKPYAPKREKLFKTHFNYPWQTGGKKNKRSNCWRHYMKDSQKKTLKLSWAPSPFGPVDVIEQRPTNIWSTILPFLQWQIRRGIYTHPDGISIIVHRVRTHKKAINSYIFGSALLVRCSWQAKSKRTSWL